MRILYLVPHTPSPIKSHSYYGTRGLHAVGHHVTIATLERSPEDAVASQRLRERGFNVISVPIGRPQLALNSLIMLPSQKPMQARFAWSARLMAAIERHVAEQRPDIVHVEHLRMTPYGMRLSDRFPVVWDAVDHLASLYRQSATISPSPIWRAIASVEAPRLAGYERWLTGQFPATLAISRGDQAQFQEANPFADRVQIAPLGLPLGPGPTAREREPQTLIITGAMNYDPNVASVLYFAKEILPLIWQTHPEVRLQIVGAHPTAAIQALSGPQVTVTGFVPSLSTYLSQATIAIAPVTYGAGTQVKVLEAFQHATPLVATSVALRGSDVRDGEEALIADDPPSFAAAVARLLDDAVLRARLGVAGRHYVEMYHDLTMTTRNLEMIYLRAIGVAGRSQ